MTLKVEWSDAYAIGDPLVDQEHKMLFHLAGQVFASTDPQSDHDELVAVVQSLFRYMEVHFAHEEDLMRRLEYPGLDDHKAKHRSIVAEMTHCIRTIKHLAEYHQRLQHLLIDWVLHHVIEEDRKLAPIVAERREANLSV